MANEKKRSGNTFFAMKTTVKNTVSTPTYNLLEIPTKPLDYIFTMEAAEDLTGWKGKPVMMSTNDRAYKAEAKISNWNRIKEKL